MGEINNSSDSMRMGNIMARTNTYAMAPSPAPGEDPVSRNRVRVNMGDDPLGLGAGISPSPAQMTSQQSNPYMNSPQNHGQLQTGATNVPRQAGNQMTFNQTSNSQSYNGVRQQPQQVHYSETMYSQNLTGMRQSYPVQTQQSVQPSNSSRPLAQHIQQQQSSANSYSSQNTNVNQHAFTSYGNNNQFTHTQQHSALIPSNGMLPGNDMHSSYGLNSRTSSNMSFQTNIGSNGPNQMHTTQTVSGLHGLQVSQYNQTPSTQALLQGGQIQTPGIPPSVSLISSSQIQNAPYQTVTATTPYQQTRNSQSNANHIMHQQSRSNNVQTAISHGNIANQSIHQPSSTNYEQKSQSYEAYNQSPLKVSNIPTVETVIEVDQQINYTAQFAATTFLPQSQQEQPIGHQTSSSNEGLGIDARTQLVTPSAKAAKAAETVQGAPNSADGRRTLLESALRCDLPKYLIESVLENPNLLKVKDPASVKVHAVELLKLLTQDPGYGLKFKLILRKIPSWKKYASQDHSLFITGLEQKADYFLTDGGTSLDSKKLLTNK